MAITKKKDKLNTTQDPTATNTTTAKTYNTSNGQLPSPTNQRFSRSKSPVKRSSITKIEESKEQQILTPPHSPPQPQPEKEGKFGRLARSLSRKKTKSGPNNINNNNSKMVDGKTDPNDVPSPKQGVGRAHSRSLSHALSTSHTPTQSVDHTATEDKSIEGISKSFVGFLTTASVYAGFQDLQDEAEEAEEEEEEESQRIPKI
ncbi:unnamed protein product [Ambrosiozyma monospora]|uniref:Unnamed protein product n=1 Tax=Ambrosiozyma monospora TaxID=43982 RepID=A0ACB5T9G5_AMBMO|nr:unnamed protein product [Ambrosiozyma monospora]